MVNKLMHECYSKCKSLKPILFDCQMENHIQSRRKFPQDPETLMIWPASVYSNGDSKYSETCIKRTPY